MLDANPETIHFLAVAGQRTDMLYGQVAAVETMSTIRDFCRLSKMLCGSCKAGSFGGSIVVERSTGY